MHIAHLWHILIKIERKPVDGYLMYIYCVESICSVLYGLVAK